MASIRQDKVASLIRRDLGEILQQKSTDILSGKMISVTVVRMSPDLSFAKVFVSIFPSEDLELEINTIRSHTNEIRFLLGKRVKNQLRIVPEIGFFVDDSLDYAERINELLS